MKLSDLYQSLDQEGRKALAVKAGIDAGYLWQIATKWRGKKPSVDVIDRLLQADRRLKAADLIAEFADKATKDTAHPAKEPSHA